MCGWPVGESLFMHMHHSFHNSTDDDVLIKRVSPVHLQQRLGIERDHEAQIFGQGRNFFHPENWYSIRALLRTTLRLSLMHRRGQRNIFDIAIRRNELHIPDLPAAFDGFTLLHLSDLHVDIHPAFPQALVERISAVEYDIAVLTGDFRADTFGAYTAAMEGMARVSGSFKGPVYGVLGNHDTIRMVPPLEAMGIRMLLNESIALERGDDTVYLAGIDDPHYYQSDNLEKACEHIPPQAISLLLAHSPEIYRRAAHVGFNVMLCGHTHGGQICLPGGRPLMCNARCPRRLCAGAWQYHQLLGYTSVGAGASIVGARFNCQPEVTVHHLRKA
jgi:predicted MPP superfamily phosphohydrolase